MWIISGKLTWIPLYVLMLFLAFHHHGWKHAVAFLVVGVLSVAIADQMSSHLLKELIMRYRPSHHALLTDKLHFYQFEDGSFYKGGMYGFVSSHAANFFAICTFAGLHLRKKYPRILLVFLIIASLVAYSRIYLGVHYLSDLVCGAALGTLIGWGMYRFVFLTIVKRIPEE